MTEIRAAEYADSGIAELNQILCGGYPRGRLTLLEGRPGSGKTTLAMQFLLAGAKAGESTMYVTFSETAEELRQSGASHGWDLSKITIVELTKGDVAEALEDEYTVLHSAEVELSQISTALLDKITQDKPQRLVLDSLSELRMVAHDPLRYRRQILALKQTLSERGCTVIFLEDLTGTGESDLLLQSIAHGVILLSSELSHTGGIHRRIQVTKMRGVNFIDGQHDCKILRGGLAVYPRLLPGERRCFNERAGASFRNSGARSPSRRPHPVGVRGDDQRSFRKWQVVAGSATRDGGCAAR